MASRTLLEKGVTALLSWGSAGGLSRELSPGSLILPKTVVASDQSLYYVETSWHQRLCNRLKGHVDFHTEPLAESATVVCTPVEKAVLFQRTGAIGVDMESAAVAIVAQEARVPFMVVRAVADSLDTTIPKNTLNALDEFGRWSFLRLILELAEHPGDLLALVRLGRNYRAAQRTLAAVARLAGDKLFESRNTTEEGARKL
jgi:adenosylhomocysteine nucleosidase